MHCVWAHEPLGYFLIQYNHIITFTNVALLYGTFFVFVMNQSAVLILWGTTLLLYDTDFQITFKKLKTIHHIQKFSFLNSIVLPLKSFYLDNILTITGQMRSWKILSEATVGLQVNHKMKMCIFGPFSYLFWLSRWPPLCGKPIKQLNLQFLSSEM